MSWPPIWQTPNQTQGGGTQTPAAMNMGMYQLTAEQQYALQQQNWQQWQIYQSQMAQWQAQYGEQFQQMQNGMMTTQNLLSSAYMQSMLPPPPPVDQQPPPPPPPQQQENTQNIRTSNVQQSTHNFNESVKEQQPSTSQPSQMNQALIGNNQTPQSNSAQNHDRTPNANYSQQNQDALRRQQNSFRNNRWNNNNNQNNRNSRSFGGNNNFNNRNAFDRNDQVNDDSDATQQQDGEEKSQEEIAFDIQFQKWEDSFMAWKRNNANHPDRNQYNDFVIKMEDCRKQLLQKRELLRQKRIRETQTQQNNQTNNQTNDQTENQTETFENKQVQDDIATATTTQSFGDQTTASGSGLFPSSGNNDGIPGLDLVNEEKPFEKPSSNSSCNPSKSDLNIVAHVNNILGNPEIQSLLSNIQRQQNESDAPKPEQKDADDTNEDCSQSGSNQTDNQNENVGNQENYRMNNEMSQQNPFRQNDRDDMSYQMHQQQQQYLYDQPKRSRRWNDNNSNDCSPQFGQHSQDRGNFGQQQSMNQDFNFGGSFRNNNRKRGHQDSYNNSFNQMQSDCEEFRPMKVIDYQNRTSNQSPFEDRPRFGGNFMSNRLPPLEDHFPRKIIEYDHKSKVHTWNCYCPVVQIEYNHTKTGYSLHEYPPPKPLAKIPDENFSRQRPEFKQLRQPKWEQGQFGQSHERFSQQQQQQQQQQHYQSRYESRQNYPSNSQASNEMYQRRNPQDKNWNRNFREWKAPYERWPDAQSKFPSSSFTSSSSSSYHRTDTAIKVEPSPKYSLKDLIFQPGRNTRPKRIVILMRGIPGSGKSYISKMIKDKEQEMGGSARILSIDDYFMVEPDSESTSTQHLYEYDAKMEDTYTQYLLKAFKKTCADKLYDCVIIDCNNTRLQYLGDFYFIAQANFFTPFICELPLDVDKCLKNNIHNRTESDIRKALKEWEPTPSSYTVLDYECLFNSADNTEAISDADDDNEDAESLDAISDDENASGADKNMHDDFSDIGDDEPINEFGVFKSKWDNDTTVNKLARLDGTNKPIKHATIEDYLQMDGWEPPPSSTNGKKRVRWADIEEKREHDKQRAIGFVVGQTNWSNLIENQPRDHTNALTKIKYIEKVRKH